MQYNFSTLMISNSENKKKISSAVEFENDLRI